MPSISRSARAFLLLISLSGAAVYLSQYNITAAGVTRYMATNGRDAGDCARQSSPCKTFAYSFSQLQGGDTLIVGNGSYEEPMRDPPSGSAGAYTVIKAQTDFGVTVDSSRFAASDAGQQGGIIYGRHYITIRGFRFIHYGAPYPISSDHIKFIRNSFEYADTEGNTASFANGPASDYVLWEENIAFGGARYQFLTYQSNHTVFRRNIARNDYYSGTWQSAAYASYDSDNTMHENNIAIDSDRTCCVGRGMFYGANWNEKNEGDSKTNQRFLGNIVLNYHTAFGANNDTKASGSRIMMDNIYWDNDGGYQGGQGPGDPVVYELMSNFTAGGSATTYKPGTYSSDTGLSIYNDTPNLVKNSIFANNRAFGISDYVRSSHNAFSGNVGGNTGHSKPPFDNLTFVPPLGPGDITNINVVYHPVTNPRGPLKYLPRGPEPATPLAIGGDSGGRIGAQVMWKIGVDGTLWGEPGWDTVRSPANGYGKLEDRLWPFPNESVAKTMMAAYRGPGAQQGPRGFAAAGDGLYGGPRTLTSYVWEYLGAPMPSYDQMYANLSK